MTEIFYVSTLQSVPDMPGRDTAWRILDPILFVTLGIYRVNSLPLVALSRRALRVYVKNYFFSIKFLQKIKLNVGIKAICSWKWAKIPKLCKTITFSVCNYLTIGTGNAWPGHCIEKLWPNFTCIKRNLSWMLSIFGGTEPSGSRKIIE